MFTMIWLTAIFINWAPFCLGLERWIYWANPKYCLIQAYVLLDEITETDEIFQKLYLKRPESDRIAERKASE